MIGIRRGRGRPRVYETREQKAAASNARKRARDSARRQQRQERQEPAIEEAQRQPQEPVAQNPPQEPVDNPDSLVFVHYPGPKTPQAPNTLANPITTDYLDVPPQPRIPPHPGGQAGPPPQPARRWLFSEDNLSIRHGIESAGGFADSLAVARKGLNWLVVRSQGSNLTNCPHPPHLPVKFFNAESGKWQSPRVPAHQAPHLPLGRLAGMAAVEIYLLFPQLYHPSRPPGVIGDVQRTQWTREVFQPALRDILPAELMQHLIAVVGDIQAQAIAQRKDQLQQHYFIPPQYLEPLWRRIHYYMEQNHSGFRECRILITAQGLKTEFSDPQWAQMWNRFFSVWDGAVNRALLSEDFYNVANDAISSYRSFR